MPPPGKGAGRARTRRECEAGKVAFPERWARRRLYTTKAPNVVVISSLLTVAAGACKRRQRPRVSQKERASNGLFLRLFGDVDDAQEAS